MSDPTFNFTPRAQQAIALARREAARLHHAEVGTEHLLLGLLALGQGVVVKVLKNMGADLANLQSELEKQSPRSAQPADNPKPEGLPFSKCFKMALSLASKESKALNHRYIGTEHLLLGLMREKNGVAARVLTKVGIDLEQTRAEIIHDLDPNGGDKKTLFVPAGEVDRIRQELAVLKSKVEGLGSTVEQASQRSPTPVIGHGHASTSLRPLSEPPKPKGTTVVRALNYALLFVALVWLVRMLLGRPRKS